MTSEQHPSLLLLPFPPRPPSRASLSAAYRPSLHAALSKIKSPSRSSVLVVAVVCPILRGYSPKTKSLSWPAAQSLLAGIYSLIAVVCAEQAIATDAHGGPGSVDARVVLVDHDAKRRFAPDFVAAVEPNNTTVVDLPTFASAYHPWSYIFHVNSEQGYRTLSTYLKFAEGRQTILQSQLVVVEAGLSMNVEDGNAAGEDTPGYSIVCLGGTFDHLHPGHKLLLQAAVLLLKVPDKDSASSCRLVVGITGDQMLKNKKYAELVQSWDDRARYTLEFLASLLELDKGGWKKRKFGAVTPAKDEPGHIEATFRNGTITVELVQFQDVYGPTITVPEMDVLVFSGETRSGGKAVNDKRIEQGWKPLETFEVDVLDAQDLGDEEVRSDNFASKISSTAIRQQKSEAAAKSSL